jgi:hypothetical protein
MPQILVRPTALQLIARAAALLLLVAITVAIALAAVHSVHRERIVTRLQALGADIGYDNDAIREQGIQPINRGREFSSLDDEYPDDLVTRVTFSRPDCSDEEVPLLAQLPRLRTLHLGGIWFTDKGLEQLARTTRLEVLALHRPSLANGETISCLAQMPSLRRLDLQGDFVRDSTLRGLGKLTGLKELSIDTSICTPQACDHLAGLTSLEKLRLAGPGITDGSLAFLPNLTKLRELDLTGTAVTSRGLDVLPQLPQLSNLILSETMIQDDVGPVLRRMPALSSLEMDKTRIGDGCLAELPAASLAHLNLSFTRVSDEGMDHVARCTNLASLNVLKTDVTLAGAHRLQPLMRLERLEIGPNLDPAALKGFQATMPKVHIYQQN